jgi:DNA-binding HxlR family transcriptional regulator
MVDTHESGEPCPVVPAVEAFVGRWKGGIVWWLRDGPQRFGELRRQLPGVTPKVLTEQLRQLERDGFVERRVLEAKKQRVEYSLTPLCRTALPLFDSIVEWWREHEREVESARSSYVEDGPAGETED